MDLCLTQQHEIWNNPAQDIHPLSFAARLLDENNGFLSNAWNRFACIDLEGKEWGQPYYANDGLGKGKAILLRNSNAEEEN